MPRNGRGWTTSELDRMFKMRDEDGAKWIDIARALRRCGIGRDGPAACCAAYNYWKAKFAREAEMRAAGIEPPKRAAPMPDAYGRGLAASRAQVAELNSTVRRPRYFHDADMDIIGRIDRQGLTSGFFGDPIPGRSALDKRQEAKQ